MPTTTLLPPAPGPHLPWLEEPEILDEAPAFMISRSRLAHYCHRPRSGWRRQNGRTSFNTWCGQLIYNPITVDRPDALTPLCATCEGRAVGAGWPTAEEQLTGRFATQRPVVTRFTPRAYYDPPTWCPGSTGEFYLPTPHNWRLVTCLVCHAEVRLTATGSWWRGLDYGPQRHPPEHIIPPCRRHAWRHLTWLDPDRYLIGCRCQQEDPHG